MGFLDVVRAILGLLLLLFIPGFAWTWAFFRRRDMGALELVVYAIALSIALVSIAMFFMNQVAGVRINLVNSLLIILALTAIPMVHLFLKRRGIYDRWPFKRPRQQAEDQGGR